MVSVCENFLCRHNRIQTQKKYKTRQQWDVHENRKKNNLTATEHELKSVSSVQCSLDPLDPVTIEDLDWINGIAADNGIIFTDISILTTRTSQPGDELCTDALLLHFLLRIWSRI